MIGGVPEIRGAAVGWVCREYGRWLYAFLSHWGDDGDVADVTAMLFDRWARQMNAEDARILAAKSASDVATLLRSAAEYIDFHGPHMWAGLLTEEGVRASLRGRRAAEGSY